MALKVTTSSGTRYILNNGRVTRCRALGDRFPYPVIREIFSHGAPLKVGASMVLRVPGVDPVYPILTTPVTEIVSL